MIKQLSPGIEVTEIDNIETVNIFSEGINAAMVGDFAWGPVDYPIKINNVNDLKKYFSTPKKEEHNISYFTAYNFLNYESGGLYVVRSAGDNARNAVSTFDDTDFIRSKPSNQIILTANTDFDTANNSIKVNDGSGANTVANVAEGMFTFKDPRDNVLQYTDTILEHSDIKVKDFYYTTPNTAFKSTNQYIASTDANGAMKSWFELGNKLPTDNITANTYNLNILQVKGISMSVPKTETDKRIVYLNNVFAEIGEPSTFKSLENDDNFKSTNPFYGLPEKELSSYICAVKVTFSNDIPTFTPLTDTTNKTAADEKLNSLFKDLNTNLYKIYYKRTDKTDNKYYTWNTNKPNVIIIEYDSSTTTYRITINATEIGTNKINSFKIYPGTSKTDIIKLANYLQSQSYDITKFDYKLSANVTNSTPTVTKRSPITFSAYVALSNTSTSSSVTETDTIKYVQLELKNNENSIKSTFDLSNTSILPTKTSGVLEQPGITKISSDTDNIKWHRIQMTSNTADTNVSGMDDTKDKTFIIRAVTNNINNIDSSVNPAYSDLTNNIVLHIAAPQVEQNNSMSSYKIHPDKPSTSSLPYLSRVNSANNTTKIISFSSGFTPNDDQEIYTNDKLYFRSYSTNAVDTIIKNKVNFQDQESYLRASSIYNMFIARYPGEMGNSLKVVLCSDPDKYEEVKNYFKDIKSIKTTESVYTVLNRDINDVLYYAVIDTKGVFSGTKDSVLETARLSKCMGVMENGYNIYYYDWINTYSKYVYIGDIINYSTWNLDIEQFKQYSLLKCGAGSNIVKQLAGGKNDSPKSSNYMDSFNTLKNNKEYNYDIIMGGAHEKDVIQHVHDNIVLNRKDCVLTISPPINVLPPAQNTPASSVLDYMSDFDSSYIFADSGWKYQYNLFNSKYFWMPLNPDIAGVIARTSIEQNPWYSPAGYNRGKIKNVTKLAWNPTKDEMDEIYPVGINPVIKESNEGTILFGDRMKTSRPTIMNKFNVRFLFLTIEKYIKSAAKFKLFEFNDTYTRETFKAQIESYLRSVQSRRGIEEFMVVCDESNNTSDVINSSGFVADIYIRPAMSINFIQLNFINTPSGIEFNVAD